MSAPYRVVLFVDYGNASRNARELFSETQLVDTGDSFDPRVSVGGHFRPWALAQAICARHDANYPNEPAFDMVAVRVYYGMPHRQRHGDDGKAYAAAEQQTQVWEAESDTVIPIRPPLGYVERSGSRNVPPSRDVRRERVQRWRVTGEKEVDTQLTIDLVCMAIDGEYDVAVLFSADRDFRPAIMEINRRFGPNSTPRVDLAGWLHDKDQRFLSLPGSYKPRRYPFDQRVYEKVADDTDYSSATPLPKPGAPKRGQRKRQRNPERENLRAAKRRSTRSRPQ